jgi:hypothetical protein
MPTYIIRKKVKANNIIDAINKEPLAKISDVLFEEEEDEDPIFINGFTYCEQKDMPYKKTKITIKKSTPKKPMAMPMKGMPKKGKC